MLTTILADLYSRDLGRLKDEVLKFENEADLWKKEGEIPNSAGNLTLHIIGNLKHFIGAVLGNSGYIRERDLEFSTGSAGRDELLKAIDETAAIVKATLEKLTDEDLEKDYPIEVFKERSTMSSAFFLIHLTTHLNYHLGQINYHRRLLAS